MELSLIQQLVAALKGEIGKIVVGQADVVEKLVLALLCEGHVLIEGVPGTGKTLMSRTFAGSLRLEFNRIQFTPDLMPGDVIGTTLYNFQTQAFSLTKGPVFTDFLLADEINRTPPKTQSALLQAMAEREVTIDGRTHPLSPAFMVVATQNPIEQEGTYPLPEAQLDRFLFKLHVGYPLKEHEKEIVRRHGNRTAMPRLENFDLRVVADINTLTHARQLVAQLVLSEPIIDYIVELVRATREHPSIMHGASPRAGNMLAMASRALAAISGRNFVIPDDVKMLMLPVMRHRVLLAPSAEIEGLTADDILRQIIDATASPR